MADHRIQRSSRWTSAVTSIGMHVRDNSDAIFGNLVKNPQIGPEIQPTLTTIPNSIDEIISLGQDVRQGVKFSEERYKRIIPFVHSSLCVGRCLDRAVVLVVGSTRQGKSKTINRLIGQNIFKVGKPASGSTTKDVQRVSVQSPTNQTGVEVSLSFDDTPGLEDTTHEDRERNSILMHRYCKAYYPVFDTSRMKNILKIPTQDFRGRTYPNAILLVAGWDTIHEDAHNDPVNFTSSIGKSMQYLKGSDLVDHEHQNVIVVITKALTFWSDYDDLDYEEEKHDQWVLDAAAKTKIIDDLRSKVFPCSNSWRVLFVENGGATNPKKHRTLPNGELSHQNLFQAIYDLVTVRHATAARDLVGIQALRFLTGEPSIIFSLLPPPDAEILIRLDHSEQISDMEILEAGLPVRAPIDKTTPRQAPLPPSNYWLNLAKNRLGFIYNPVYKSFGRSPVVNMEDSDIHIERNSSRQLENIVHTTEHEDHSQLAVTQLKANFRISSIAGIGLQYSSSSHAGSSASSLLKHYKATKVTAVATLKTLVPTLSVDIVQEEVFHDVWDTCNVKAAYGGVLRIVVRDDSWFEEEVVKGALGAEADLPIAAQIGVDVGARAMRATGKEHHKGIGERFLTIDRDGGRIVASQLTSTLEDLFAYLRDDSLDSPAPQKWIDVRTRWMEALETDSVFCANDPETQYLWLYSLKGLNEEQGRSLQDASEWYLRSPMEDLLPPTPQVPLLQTKEIIGHLPRKSNLEQVDIALKDAKVRWWSRFWKLLF